MKTIRVLVADDDEDHRFFITRSLHAIDSVRVEVETVEDGADALDYLYRRGAFTDRPRPHLVVLDLKMPRVSGLEVLAQVKGDPDLRMIPVTVLSSSDREEDVDASYGSGGNSYVVKPSSFADADAGAGLRIASEFWADVAALPSPPG